MALSELAIAVSIQILEVIGTFSTVFLALLGLRALNIYRAEQTRAKSRFTLEFLEKHGAGTVSKFSSYRAVQDILVHQERGEGNEQFNDNTIVFLNKLNKYETISIAVRKNIIDPDLVWEICGPVIVSTFQVSKEIIENIRIFSDNATAYSDLEALARLWHEREAS